MKAIFIFVAVFSLLLFISSLDARKLEDDRSSHGEKENSETHVHVLSLPSMDRHKRQSNAYVHGHNHDDNSALFFTMESLKLGKKWPIYFLPTDLSTSGPLLTREKAESIPFSYKQLTYILQLLSFSPESPQAKVIEETLRHCESPHLTGETKFCATSFESMLDFIQSIFGSEVKDFKAITSTHLTSSKTIVQNYTIMQEPKVILSPKFASCHPVSYPYRVFYCHSQSDGTKAFRVSLAGENGDRIEAVAFCHLDTSEWDPHHRAFQDIGSKPGLTEVCHFFPADHMLWVQTDQA